MYSDEEFLPLSGVQHFAFCRRQWALIHVEQAWAENLLTTEGSLMHGRAHDEELREKRGDVITVRGLGVHSNTLGLSGKCDVVEFRRCRNSEDGHPLAGEEGFWRPFPVEYKHGESKAIDADRLQLCAQAMCLEEMLGCDVRVGCLFYGKTRSREEVLMGKALREQVVEVAAEMHGLFTRRHTPKAKRFAGCRACSLAELCVALGPRHQSVAEYMAEHMEVCGS